jgi:hypothetical protein
VRADIERMIDDFIVMQYRVASMNAIKFPQFNKANIERLEKSVVNLLTLKAFINVQTDLDMELICCLIGIAYEVEVLNFIFRSHFMSEWNGQYIPGSNSDALYVADYAATDMNNTAADFSLELKQIKSILSKYGSFILDYDSEMDICCKLVAGLIDAHGITSVLPQSIIRQIKQSYSDIYGGNINALCN